MKHCRLAPGCLPATLFMEHPGGKQKDTPGLAKHPTCPHRPLHPTCCEDWRLPGSPSSTRAWAQGRGCFVTFGWNFQRLNRKRPLGRPLELKESSIKGLPGSYSQIRCFPLPPLLPLSHPISPPPLSPPSPFPLLSPVPLYSVVYWKLFPLGKLGSRTLSFLVRDFLMLQNLVKKKNQSFFFSTLNFVLGTFLIVSPPPHFL